MNLSVRLLSRFSIALILVFLFGAAPTVAQAQSVGGEQIASAKKTAKKKKKKKRYRRRRCDPATGKKKALQHIQANQWLAELSDLPYVPMLGDTASYQALLRDDSELPADNEDMLEQIDDVGDAYDTSGDMIIDDGAFEDMWHAYVAEMDVQDEYMSSGIEKKALMNQIMQWIGTRYRYGGTTTKGIDCSAFIQRVYNKAGGVELPRTARMQYTQGLRVESLEDLQFGDLVFFQTRRRPRVSHVGVYLGDKLFAHASSRYGVTVSSLESTYYNKRFICGQRLMPEHLIETIPGEEPGAKTETRASLD